MHFILIAFLACALALLAVSAWIMRCSLLTPVQDLGLTAKRLGKNDLEMPAQIEGPEDVRALSQAFDEVCSRLRVACEELIRWNSTLEQRVAQRIHELEILNEVSREILSRLDIQQVLNSVTDKARTLLGGEIALLCLVDTNQYWLKLLAVSGPKLAVVGDTMSVEDGFADSVVSCVAY